MRLKIKLTPKSKKRGTMIKTALTLAAIMAIVLGFVSFVPGQAQAQSGWAQVTMQNNTPFTLDLYVDNDYGCRALSGMFCTTQIRVGNHTLTAKTSDGSRSTTEGPFYFAQGVSPTWTVNYEEQRR
ncbi:MAG: hypothetical protein Q8N77_01055 [Nanoarchaeota archaeon]|nr:hypothetical protein [Nanoarchaeota archaeon]